jgi:PAS domain S-box-containing protein
MIFQPPAAGSLAHRFAVAAAALAAIALSVTALASLWIVSQQHTAALRTLVQKEVDFNAATVSANLHEISSHLSDVADNSILATALIDSAGKQTYLTPYLHSIQKIDGIPVQILFADFEGKEIANNGNASFNEEQLAWLRAQIDHGREAAAIFPGDKGSEMVVVELLSYSRTRTPEGALLYKIALNDLQRNLMGTLVWHTHDPSREPAATASSLSARIDIPPNLAPLGFHIHADADAMATPGGQLIPQYLIIFLIIGASAAGVLVIGSRLALSMTKDLRRLEAFSTSMVAHGFGAQRAEVSGSNEVASLARSINHMLDSLYEQHTQLQHESEKLRQLANTIPQLAWMAHPDGKIHWFNDRWYAYTGLAPDLVLSVRWETVLDPQILPAIVARWKASLTTGEPFEMTFPMRGADGEYRPFFTRAAPLRDADGNIVQWFGTNTDVSTLERAEKAVRESEERLREGLVAARMTVWDWNLKTQHFKFSANAQEVLGHSWDNVSAITSTIHPDDRQPHRDRIERAIAERSQYESLIRAIRPDNNKTIWLEVRGKVHCDASGKPYSISGVALDVTERRRAEEELRTADRRKDEFLAMLAHELRNPLAPISTAAELLNMLHIDEPRVRQTSEIIARQVGHMTGLIDDLLDVSRVTRGIITLEKESLDVNGIVAGAVEQVRSLIETRGHRLTVQAPPEPVRVRGDQTRLIQVMSNLLNNAAKYTPNGGEIRLEIEATAHEVLLRVSDTGVGITADLLPHVFELFSQAERSPDRSQGGLGLGLALVKSLIELHQGSVSAHSDGVGKGSEFVVRLPRLVELPILQGHDNRDSSIPRSATALRLMVVDDNVDAAQSLAMLFEAWGHQVSVEHEGRGALERARTEVPQVILLDIGLPDMDGYALARQLRAMPQTAHAVLIALTGYGQQEDRNRSRHAGIDHHLVKPTNPLELANLLAGLTGATWAENRH